MKRLPARQIHLDFHTSPLIPGVGSKFDKDTFGKRLKKAKVNSINLFAKCHHGLCYYPTKLGRIHPSLEFDLLGQMIEACHENGIKAPIYFTTGWEEVAAENMNWLQIPVETGLIGCKETFQDQYYTWRALCHNKEGYVEHIIGQVDELIELYDVDGFWFDIVHQRHCVCDDCLKSMKELGLDRRELDDVKKHDQIVEKNFQERVYNHIKAKLPEALIYFNMALTPDNGDREEYSIRQKLQFQTQYEIESLPSGAWGYNHFPLYVNYLEAIDDKEVIGMNGKFHTSWGDFGSLKNIEALEYECFRMVANGGKCCVGDQLHPRGELDEIVYDRIGEVYGKIEEREEWLYPSQRLSEVGVLLNNRTLQGELKADEGAMRMFMELHVPFDFIDRLFDFTKYRLIVLPDNVVIDEKLKGKLEEFLAGGGKIIATGRSGLTPDGSAFALKEFGLKNPEENPYAPYYLKIEDSFRGDIQPFEYAQYEKGMKVEVDEGTEALGYIGKTYFNRTPETYCSHRQTPFDEMTDWPAITANDQVLYFAHPIFTDYIIHGLKLHRDLFAKALNRMLKEPAIKSEMPPTVEMVFRQQEGRKVVHLIHYIPERKCKNMEIIDTMIPLYNQKVSVKLDRAPKKVYGAPSMRALAFSYEDGYAHITVDEIKGYEIVVIEE